MSRGRRPNINPMISLHTHLPQDVYAQLTVHLYSEVEHRVPVGAVSRFLSERIREYFSNLEKLNANG